MPNEWSQKDNMRLKRSGICQGFAIPPDNAQHGLPVVG
jgi:hypothetical protein